LGKYLFKALLGAVMKLVKLIFQRYFPFIPLLHQIYKKYIDKNIMRKQTVYKRFDNIYKQNKWRDTESKSGVGSSLSQTVVIRAVLPRLINRINIESMLDIPCGDLNWMKEIELPLKCYIGADIVDDIIKSNKTNFNHNKSFIQLDIINDKLPKVDLIFCRDCLVHFSISDVFKSLENIKKSRSKYILTTTFTSREKNNDIITGQWRTLNMQKAPFNWPDPIEIINENCTQKSGKFSDKSLGLWKIEDMPL
jgi:SAM-dependent methyltransferase